MGRYVGTSPLPESSVRDPLNKISLDRLPDERFNTGLSTSAHPSASTSQSSPFISRRRSRSGSSSSFEEPPLRGTPRPPKRWFRRRVHALALMPALCLGAFLGALWIGRDGDSGISILKPSLNGQTSWPTFGGGTPNAHPGTVSPLLPIPYVHHSSGHVFYSPSYVSTSRDPAPFHEPHPIYGLIENATRSWNEKVKRQSKSLDHAVREYRRRNGGLNPPKGFDDWFRFARSSKVILLDEYDQISRDITPFLSLPSSVLQSRSQKLQLDPNTYTFFIPSDPSKPIEIRGAQKDLKRAVDGKRLMERWRQFIPGELNVTMSAQDGPGVLLDWGSKERHYKYAAERKLLEPKFLEQVDDDPSWWGWPLACPPQSRLRRAFDGQEVGSLPSGPSFVEDHLATMDLCRNPEWQDLHGFTSWEGPRPGILQPLFSMSKTTLHSDLLAVPLEQYFDLEAQDPSWEEKTRNSTFIWRGSTTGIWFERKTRWRTSQRMRLYFMKQDKLGKKKVRFVERSVDVPEEEHFIEKEVRTTELVKRYMDFGFSGKMNQCTGDGSCERVLDIIKWEDEAMIWPEQNFYKYQLDVDGNAWSGRFHRLMSSNSCVLKATIFPEWYSDRIQPWVHFVPLKIDYSDLFDVMAFFNGDMEGNFAHDDIAKKIAMDGKEWAEAHWRWEDMEAYFFRLILEWARVMTPDRKAWEYRGPGTD